MTVVRESGGARVRVEPDETMYDDSWVDDPAYRAELWRTIERDGVWGFVGDVPNDELDAALAVALAEWRMVPCAAAAPFCRLGTGRRPTTASVCR